MTYKSWKEVLDEDIKDCGDCLVNLTTPGAIIFATIWVCINTLVRIFKLQPGQWVYAGNKADKGIYLGMKASGSIVVAWYHTAINRASFKAYVRTLRNYAIQ